MVFLDLMMPEMSGEQVLENMKRISPHVPIIFMSGSIVMEKDEFIEKGAYDFIQKPFDVNQIFDILSRVSKKSE